MKLQGSLGDNSIIIMIDSGANHCFISDTLVAKLKLPVQPTPLFTICLGNVHCLHSSGICNALPLTLNTLQIAPDCYVFPLGGVDVILDISWL